MIMTCLQTGRLQNSEKQTAALVTMERPSSSAKGRATYCVVLLRLAGEAVDPFGKLFVHLRIGLKVEQHSTTHGEPAHIAVAGLAES
jgi:hypothetical protein